MTHSRVIITFVIDRYDLYINTEDIDPKAVGI